MSAPLVVGDTVIITWTRVTPYFFEVGDRAVITHVIGETLQARFENGNNWSIQKILATCERLHEEDHPRWEVV